MKKAKTSVKIAIASVLAVSSTAAAIYAAPKMLEASKAMSGKTTVHLDVEKIDADTVKVSLDKIDDIAKSLQFSIKLDGDVRLKDGSNGIKNLLNNNGQASNNTIFTDYTYNEDSNTIDVIITAEDFLPKIESKIEIFELDIESVESNSKTTKTFNIIPENEESYKYVSNTSKEYDDIEVEYDTTPITLNTAPTIKYTASDNISIIDGEVLVFDEISEIVTEDVEGDEVTLEVRNITNIPEDKEDNQPIITEFSSEDIGTYTFKVNAVDSNGDKSEPIEILVDVHYDLNLAEPSIKGIENIEVQSGTVFNPLDGVIATDARGRELEVKVSGELNLDPEVDTEYILKYSATDRYGKTKEVERKVKVIANNAPIITGVDNIVINIGDKFDPMDGVKVTDDIDNNLTSSIVVNGKVNTLVAGEYKLSYSVTDSGNKTTRAQRIVRVNRNPIISGYDSSLIVKSDTKITKEMILGGISITDETEYVVDVEVPVINGVGRYEATIKVTDNDNAVTTVTRSIIVSDEAITELPNSGNGTAEDDAKLIQVIDAEGINKLNEKLSAATKDYLITTTKKKLTSYTEYNFVIEKKEAIFRNTEKI